MSQRISSRMSCARGSGSHTHKGTLDCEKGRIIMFAIKQVTHKSFYTSFSLVYSLRHRDNTTRFLVSILDELNDGVDYAVSFFWIMLNASSCSMALLQGFSIPRVREEYAYFKFLLEPS